MAPPKKRKPKSENEENAETVLHMNIDRALMERVKIVASLNKVLMRDFIATTLRAEVNKQLPKLLNAAIEKEGEE